MIVLVMLWLTVVNAPLSPHHVPDVTHHRERKEDWAACEEMRVALHKPPTLPMRTNTSASTEMRPASTIHQLPLS